MKRCPVCDYPNLDSYSACFKCNSSLNVSQQEQPIGVAQVDAADKKSSSGENLIANVSPYSSPAVDWTAKACVIAVVIGGACAVLSYLVWPGSEVCYIFLTLVVFALFIGVELAIWKYVVQQYERPIALFVFGHLALLIGNLVGACLLWLLHDAVGKRRT